MTLFSWLIQLKPELGVRNCTNAVIEVGFSSQLIVDVVAEMVSTTECISRMHTWNSFEGQHLLCLWAGETFFSRFVPGYFFP